MDFVTRLKFIVGTDSLDPNDQFRHPYIFFRINNGTPIPQGESQNTVKE